MASHGWPVMGIAFAGAGLGLFGATPRTHIGSGHENAEAAESGECAFKACALSAIHEFP
jgi:hypothetical protein